MAKTYFSRLALLGCVSGAVLGLGACSSGGGGMSAGRTLGALLTENSQSEAGNAANGSKSGAGGTGTTTTTTTGAGSGTVSNTVDSGGGGSNSMNNGGSTAPSGGNTGLLTRVSDATGDLTGGLITVAGNAVLSGGAGLGPLLTGIGQDLQSDGLGGLPILGDTVETATRAIDAGVSPVAKVTLANQTVVGSASASSKQLVGVSALSTATTPGQVATVGLLNAGAPTQLANLNVAGAQLLGSGSGTALVGGSLLSPTQAAGTAATVGLLSGAGSPAPALTPVVATVTGLVGGLSGGGGSPLPVLTPVVATVTGLVGGGSGGGATLPLTPLVATVTGLVGGLTGGGSGSGLPALPTGTLGLVTGGAVGGAVSAGPVTAGGGLLGGLGVVLTGR